jgi:hypothetical protein
MFATRLRWLSITPFGNPVVPLEYGIAAMSVAGSISTCGAASGSPSSSENGTPSSAEGVAFAESPLREARGERADAALQLGVGEHPAGDAVDQGGLVAERGRASERERAEVAAGIASSIGPPE